MPEDAEAKGAAAGQVGGSDAGEHERPVRQGLRVLQRDPLDVVLSAMPARMGALVVVIVGVGCTPEPHDTALYVCPDDQDRYLPDVAPEDTADGWSGLCEADSTWVDACLFVCTSRLCADGYVGQYCLNIDRLEAWATNSDGETLYSFYVTTAANGDDVNRCYAGCLPAEEYQK